MIQLLLLFLLSHFIADFVTQTDYMINRKREYWKASKLSKGLTEHILHHQIITLIIVVVFYGYDHYLIPSLIIIGGIHYTLDWAKVEFSDHLINKCKAKNTKKKNIFDYILEKYTFHFLIDQLLHIFTIFIVLRLFQKTASLGYLIYYIEEIVFNHAPISGNSKIILLVIFFILLTFGSGYLIAFIFKDIKKDVVKTDEIAAALEQMSEDELSHLQSNIKNFDKDFLIEKVWEVKENENNSTKSIKIQYQIFNEPDNDTSGRYIGYLERVLIAAFVVINAYPGLALLAAFKTLTRFKQLESKSFAEYYLIGTLISMVIGVVIGGLIKMIII
ncbi:DUF3307 domain-containing protein [Niallia oryzisoli]|uniref:DUF3307 domain-containing protein n=1 Tax=Niallia oryzisoli TaxID=1737571 RepID=A0ABZ2CQB2_9BACI